MTKYKFKRNCIADTGALLRCRIEISRQDRLVQLCRTSRREKHYMVRKNSGTTTGSKPELCALTYKHARQTSNIGIKRCVVVLGEGLRNLFSRHDGRDIDKRRVQARV
jgi:hypothetical protein